MRFHANGFTLIETLVALFLSTLLMAALTTVYLTVKSSHRKQMARITLQDGQRFIVTMLNKNIHHAGNASCEPDKKIDQKNTLYGYGEGNLPTFLQGKAIQNSDAIVVGECVHYHGHNQFIRMAYFVGDTNRKTSLGKPIFALYRMAIGGAREELVEHVDHLAIQYGVFTKDHRNIQHYVTADRVGDWQAVRSVSLSLLSLQLYIALRERGGQ